MSYGMKGLDLMGPEGMQALAASSAEIGGMVSSGKTAEADPYHAEFLASGAADYSPHLASAATAAGLAEYGLRTRHIRELAAASAVDKPAILVAHAAELKRLLGIDTTAANKEK